MVSARQLLERERQTVWNHYVSVLRSWETHAADWFARILSDGVATATASQRQYFSALIASVQMRRHFWGMKDVR